MDEASTSDTPQGTSYPPCYSIAHRAADSTGSSGGGAANLCHRQRLRFCPHCSDMVSRATFFRHKHAFDDYQTRQWKSGDRQQIQPHQELRSRSSEGGSLIGSDPAPSVDDGT